MSIITASALRANLYNTLANASEGTPIFVTSRKGNCVIVSEDDWNAIQETILLFSNPKTRHDIINGIETRIDDCVDELPW